MTNLKWTLYVKLRGVWRVAAYYATKAEAEMGAAARAGVVEALLIWSEDGAEGR